MKRIFYLTITLMMVTSLLTTTVSAASTVVAAPTPELGQLKVCKVAGAGVTEGHLFTIKVGNTRYSVPAGPGDGGYCVLAGQYPVGSEVTIQEMIPAGYYVSHIEVKPDRAVSKDVAQGSAIIQVGSGVTEIIFTNRAIGSPTPTHEPTPLVTATPRPTRTPTATPDCAPNCTPTSTPIPRGRLQICKETDGAGVSGYFTFNFAGRSVSVPAGACSGLIGVDAGTLTITEQSQAGYVVTDIYTIPADRLISGNHTARSATVTIVEGYAASQTIVIFRNRAVTLTATPTHTPVTHTPTNTPTGTLTTPTNTPAVCQPTVITPNFAQIPVGNSVEGLGTVNPYLNIDAKDTAVHILEGADPAVYASTVNGAPLFNAGMVAGGGFSDPTIHSALQPHQYIFTFAPGVSVSNFSLHMLDFGDFNPTGSTSVLVSMTAYNASNVVVASQQLSYTLDGPLMSPVYGDLSISGDAISATPGQPGNWTWNVSGSGIVRVVLEEGTGYDPNVGFDLLSFTVECPTGGNTPTPTSTFTVPTNTPTATPTGTVATATNTPAVCQPTVVMPIFPQIPIGTSVEGLGTIDARLNIDAKGTAVHVHEGAAPAVYASAVNGVAVMNAGTVADRGFSDPTTQLAAQPHLYTFTFAPGVSISNFSLHMLDFGDYNPTGSTSTFVSMTAYNASNVAVASQQLSYTAVGLISPLYGNLSITGDAISAIPGQPGNWTWNVSGTGIVRVVLDFGVGYDPNIGLDLLSFTVECAGTIIAPPSVATLVSPSGSITDTTPAFTWNKVNAATWYYLWVNGPSGNVIKQWYETSAVCGASTCSVTPATTLGGGAHTWWIQTWNTDGYGPWSTSMDFSLPTIPPPGAATLVSPTGNITDTTPAYTWNKVSDATWYYLWVDDSSGNVIKQWFETSTVCGASTCSTSPATTLSSGAHTFWIQTWNSAGYGPWSSSMNFSVGP